jgi:hypothetical protein
MCPRVRRVVDRHRWRSLRRQWHTGEFFLLHTRRRPNMDAYNNAAAFPNPDALQIQHQTNFTAPSTDDAGRGDDGDNPARTAAWLAIELRNDRHRATSSPRRGPATAQSVRRLCGRSGETPGYNEMPFYFLSMEATRQVATPFSNVVVPSARRRIWRFSQSKLQRAAPWPRPSSDARQSAGRPIPNNIIPTSRLDRSPELH